jgi:hypothetical protein
VEGFQFATNRYENILHYIARVRRSNKAANKPVKRRLDAAQQVFEGLAVISLRPQDPESFLPACLHAPFTNKRDIIVVKSSESLHVFICSFWSGSRIAVA